MRRSMFLHASQWDFIWAAMSSITTVGKRVPRVTARASTRLLINMRGLERSATQTHTTSVDV